MRSLIVLLVLTACASDHTTAYPCLPVREWSVIDQQNAEADLETLPQDSPLWAMMRDYKTMRDEARTCGAK